jgi:CheY-like chemotaxis protein/nitrogen-specific signal transduction histidine kinase
MAFNLVHPLISPTASDSGSSDVRCRIPYYNFIPGIRASATEPALGAMGRCFTGDFSNKKNSVSFAPIDRCSTDIHLDKQIKRVPLTRIVRSSTGDLSHDIQTFLSSFLAILESANGENPFLLDPEQRKPILQALEYNLQMMRKQVDHFLMTKEASSKSLDNKVEKSAQAPLGKLKPKKRHLIHEVRTSFTGLVGTLASLAGELSVGERKELIDDLFEICEQLDDVLTEDIQKADEGSPLPALIREFSIERLFRRIRSVTKSTHPGVRVLFEFVGDEALKSAQLRGPFLKLCEILINFTNNAIKYTRKPGKVAPERVLSDKAIEFITRPGKVQLKARGWELSENKVVLQFDVIDEGLGMSEEFMKNKLFNQWGKGEKGVGVNQDSSGLGLWLTKEFADQIGAVIRVVSVEKCGSRFSIAIELEKIQKPKDIVIFSSPEAPLPSPTHKAAFLHPTKIIVADDNSILLKQCDMHFSKAGARNIEKNQEANPQKIASFVTARSGRKAVTAFENSKDPIDVVITDMQMPEDGNDKPLSGLDVIEGIYTIAKKNQTKVPRFIICTGEQEEALAEEIEELQEAGRLPPNEILIFCKPYAHKELIQAINEIMSEQLEL